MLIIEICHFLVHKLQGKIESRHLSTGPVVLNISKPWEKWEIIEIINSNLNTLVLRKIVYK